MTTYKQIKKERNKLYSLFGIFAKLTQRLYKMTNFINMTHQPELLCYIYFIIMTHQPNLNFHVTSMIVLTISIILINGEALG